MVSFRPDSRLVSHLSPSPNFGVRPAGTGIDSLILHYTGLREDALEAWCADPGGEALAWLCNPKAEVSAHYLVHVNGEIVQIVAEEHRAWHAGRGSWGDCTDINSCSIGIEIANAGHAGGLPPYPDVQIEAVIALCRDIIDRRGIRAERILAHSDIAPDRKADPGEHFPWDALARAGVGVWIEPAPLRDGPVLSPGCEGNDVAQLRESLRRLGYGVAPTGPYDEALLRVVRAFQRHYRPALCDGLADVSTRDTLARLLDRFDHSAATRDRATGS